MGYSQRGGKGCQHTFHKFHTAMNVGKIAGNVYQHPIEAKLKHNKLQIILVSSSLVQPSNIV